MNQGGYYTNLTATWYGLDGLLESHHIRKMDCVGFRFVRTFESKLGLHINGYFMVTALKSSQVVMFV